MAFTRTFLKRCMALCLCVLLISSFGTLLSVTAASDEDGVYTPTWFDASNDAKWWDGNSYGDCITRDGFSISRPAGMVWQYRHLWSVEGGSARVDCNASGVNFKFADYPYLNYNITSSKAIDLYLQVYKLVNGSVDYNSRSFIKLAALGAGSSVGNIKMTDNTELMNLVDNDGQLLMVGIGFYTHSFSRDDTISVYSMDFTREVRGINAYDRWFTAENDAAWWDGNCGGGLNGPNGGFYLNHPNGVWQYYHRWSGNGSGTGRLDCNGPGIVADFDEMNTVSYNIKASKPIDLYVQVYRLANGAVDDSSRTFIKLKSLDSGVNSGSVDLRSSRELMAMLDADNKIQINGFSFQTNGFVYGDTIEVSAFALGKTAGDYIPPDPAESWIVNAADTNWWTWDWNIATGPSPERMTAAYAENGEVTISFKGDFLDLKYMSDNMSINVSELPYLYCDITADVSCDLYLLVSGSSEGNNGVLVKSGITGHYQEKIKLSDVLAGSISNGNLSVYGFRVVPNENPNGKSFVFKAMDFGAGDAGYFGDRPAAPAISQSTNEPTESLEVTINAPADARKVQYRIGASGAWTTYTGALSIQKNVAVGARYVSSDGQWSLITSHQISNIQKPHTDEVVPVIPVWFDKGVENKCWYNWDWQHGINDEGRFFITYPGDIWTASIGKDWCTRLETQHNDSKFHVTINLDEQTSVFYKIESEFAANVSLKIKKGTSNGSYETVKIGTIGVGKNAGSFDLGSNAELLSLSDDDNNLTVSGMIFTFGTDVGKTINVERFIFDADDAYYEGYPGEDTVVNETLPDWFTLARIDKWTSNSTPINSGDTGAAVSINTDNDWTYTVTDSAKVVNATSAGSAVRINLNAANTLFCKIRNDFDAKMQLAVKYKGIVHYVDIADVKAGQALLKFALKDNEELNAFSSNGNVTVTGVRFIPQNPKENQTLKVDLFAFNKATAVYPDYVDEDKINADKQAAAAVDRLINAIGTVTLDSKAAIDTARKAYEALTVDQKYYVTAYDVLVAAENTYYALYLESDDAKADIIDEDYIISYMKANKGTMADIVLEAGTQLSTKLLSAAKNYDCDIRVRINSKKDGKLIYSMLIRSEDITDTSVPFDTRVKSGELGLSAAAQKKLTSALSGKSAAAFALNRENKLSSYMTVGLNGSEAMLNKNVTTAYVYYFDEKTNQLTLLTTGSNVTDSAVGFSAKNGGVYLVSGTRLSGVSGSSVSGGTSPQTGEPETLNVFITLQIVSAVLFMAAAAALVINKKRGLIHDENH